MHTPKLTAVASRNRRAMFEGYRSGADPETDEPSAPERLATLNARPENAAPPEFWDCTSCRSQHRIDVKQCPQLGWTLRDVLGGGMWR